MNTTTEESSTGRITVLGMGRIGSALARRWSAAGWEVTAWNRTASRASALVDHGVVVVPDIIACIRDADLIVTVVSDGPALVDLLLDSGLIDQVSSKTLLLDLSTTDVDSSRRIAAAAAERGIRFVRGALSGSPALVEAGRASALLSGDPLSIIDVESALKPVVAGTTIVGESDEAKVVKLAINSLVGAAVLVLSEAMVTVDASGVSREAFVTALEKSAVWSPVIAYKAIALRDHDETITATTADLMKDISLATQLQNDIGVRAPVTESVLQALRSAAVKGYLNDDCLAVASSIQFDSGLPPDLPLRAPKFFSRDATAGQFREPVAEWKSSLKLDKDLSDSDLRLYPPFYVPAHIRDNNEPGRFAWIHDSVGALHHGDGWRIRTPKTEEGMLLLAQEMTRLPHDSFVIVDHRRRGYFTKDVMELMRRSYRGTALAIVEDSDTILNDVPPGLIHGIIRVGTSGDS